MAADKLKFPINSHLIILTNFSIIVKDKISQSSIPFKEREGGRETVKPDLQNNFFYYRFTWAAALS